MQSVDDYSLLGCALRFMGKNNEGDFHLVRRRRTCVLFRLFTIADPEKQK